LVLTLVAAQTIAAQQPRAPVDAAEAVRWREDLRFMAQEMPRVHRNLFHTMTREQFDAAVKRLDERIPSLARHQIIVELARIVAMVQDGHTNIAPTRDPKIGFHSLPIKMYFFKDGLFIRAAAKERADLVGARVIKIGRATTDEAYTAVRDLIGRDNEMDARFFAPHLLVLPEVLQALGLIETTESATLTIEIGGKQRQVTLSPVGIADMMPPDTDTSWSPKQDWVDARDGAAKPALWLRDPNDRFWFEYLAGLKTVYVQFNMVGDKESETIAAFCDRLAAFVDANPVDKLVLDLRLNRGGNGYLNRSLMTSLIRMKKLDERGKFFTLIGRSTFSAAQFLIDDLERYTNTIFVGEPSGGKVNSYGDSRKITLPNSGITVRVSILWWQQDERDHRQWRSPDVTAELGFNDYRAGIDPGLNAALNYAPEISLSDQLRAALAKGGAKVARDRFAAWRAEPTHVWADPEVELNRLGYELLSAKKFDLAVEIFKLEVEASPNSPDAYDSLGEAYLAAGDRDRSIASYRRALELEPRSLSSFEALRKLGVK
jgi:tetratricopeptide (TPR) repeat protein